MALQIRWQGPGGERGAVSRKANTNLIAFALRLPVFYVFISIRNPLATLAMDYGFMFRHFDSFDFFPLRCVSAVLTGTDGAPRRTRRLPLLREPRTGIIFEIGGNAVARPKQHHYVRGDSLSRIPGRSMSMR
jgi:hypothetical protein